MPAETARQERLWMSFPRPNATLGDAEEAQAAWSAVAHAALEFEPVTMLVDPVTREDARRHLSAEIDVLEVPLDENWLRDCGPTFVVGDDGRLGAVDWIFNGWGANDDWTAWEHEQHVARTVAEAAGAEVVPSLLVNEGGAIHVDGEGTVLLTDTVQLGAGRNPGWTREQVEAEIHARLGTSKAIWLPHGLSGDYGRYGTQGHVDIVAAFARPGVVVAHHQPDPAHPDHEVTREIVGLLKSATDARGRRLEVVEVPAPTVLEADGHWVDYSYINHYLCNGGVVLCGFDDPRDEQAAGIFRRLFPERTVTLVDARTVFAGG
ncbi:MAG: agmatine deiminase family protein, partial [Amnibacterium sp.]